MTKIFIIIIIIWNGTGLEFSAKQKKAIRTLWIIDIK
jgi:hypothetical protein